MLVLKVVLLGVLVLIALAAILIVVGLIWGVCLSTSYSEREELENPQKIEKKRGKRRVR